MTAVVYGDAEAIVKAWLLTTSVAALVTRPDAGKSIYLAMPLSAPLPCVVLTRMGGGPRYGKDMPEDAARMSFSCWGRSRTQAGDIARAVVSECESLSHTGGFTLGTSWMPAADVSRLFWLPDPESDTARYIVDAMVTVVSK